MMVDVRVEALMVVKLRVLVARALMVHQSRKVGM